MASEEEAQASEAIQIVITRDSRWHLWVIKVGSHCVATEFTDATDATRVIAHLKQRVPGAMVAVQL